ncbi:MAG TPA: hypothetical protein VED63_13410 [Acidimicrobiales bacterium]|nr:hypothetical protein [Acidimicrobiales bacterium]
MSARRFVPGKRANLIAGSIAIVATLGLVGEVSSAHQVPPATGPANSPSGASSAPARAPATSFCPTGSPRATVSSSAQTLAGEPDSWEVILTGTFVDDASASVQPFDVQVEILGAGGQVLDRPILFANGGPIVVVNPGQYVAVTGQDAVTSTTAPTLGQITASWTWADFQDAGCPSNP